MRRRERTSRAQQWLRRLTKSRSGGTSTVPSPNPRRANGMRRYYSLQSAAAKACISCIFASSSTCAMIARRLWRTSDCRSCRESRV
eukprot:1830277-Rhodomonas_salina.1